MWLERFVIIVTSLHRDFLPSSWDMYTPTRWDWSFFVGSLGLFFSLMFLFIRFLPVISIFEMRDDRDGATTPTEQAGEVKGARERFCRRLFARHVKPEFGTPGPARGRRRPAPAPLRRHRRVRESRRRSFTRFTRSARRATR